MLGARSSEPAAGEFDGLTARELDVLVLIGDAMSNKQIAVALGVELASVKNHVHHILVKLGVRRRSEAVRVAKQQGWFRDYSL